MTFVRLQYPANSSRSGSYDRMRTVAYRPRLFTVR